jgi:hypothetical protein
MTLTRQFLAALAIPVLALTPVRTRSDADAVRQVEARWLHAEFHGDTAYLRALLLPEYRSISWKGVHDRAAILAGAVQHAANRDLEPSVTTPDVEIHGTTAIASFGGDSSIGADVFVLEHGAWHALYSQHTLLMGRAVH